MSNITESSILKYQNGNTLETFSGLSCVCELCNNDLSEPALLSCLHIFDKKCIYSLSNEFHEHNEFKCPKCHFTTCLSNIRLLNKELFVQSLNNSQNSNDGINLDNRCVLCTAGEIGIYKCSDCAGIICERCKNLHKDVVIFQSHSNIQELTNEEKDSISDVVTFLSENKPVTCTIHKDAIKEFLCIKCFLAVCSKCAFIDHKSHKIVPLIDLFDNVNTELNNLSTSCKVAQEGINKTLDELNGCLEEVAKSRDANKMKIENISEIWKSAIDKITDEFITNNKILHDNLEYQIMSEINDGQREKDHIEDSLCWVDCYLKKCSVLEASSLMKPTIECLTMLSGLKINSTQCCTSIPICLPDLEMIDNCVHGNFGSFQSMNVFHNANHLDDYQENNIFSTTTYQSPDRHLLHMVSSDPSMLTYSTVNVNFDGQELIRNQESSSFHSKINSLSKSSNGRLMANKSFSDLDNITHHSDLSLSLLQQSSSDFFSYPNELSPIMTGKGSAAASTDSGQFPQSSLFDENALISPTIGSDFQIDGLSSINSNYSNGSFRSLVNANPISKPPFPNRSRSYTPMVIKERWGSQGANRGQLNSPHGFCLGFNEEIVVADTQNHRIQIFSKDGQFVNQFGIAGREEGHLWHPRKVTVIRNTQHYVVCDRGSERSRMQIFAKNGYFIRKIAIPYIDIVAGLAINSMGHIVAVDSVSPTIFVVTEQGEMVKWIECSGQMREPSDIVVHGENYYICDFKGHCVCVYNQDGTFLFRFGNEKITNYPNGIDVSNHGDVLVGDSHGNRFHVAVFGKDGNLTGEFECPSVKVSRACGLKITSEGYLVTLAKNNHNVLVIDTLYVT